MSASFVAAVRYDEASRCNLVHIRCITFSETDLTWVLAWRKILEEEPQERFLDLCREVIHMGKTYGAEEEIAQPHAHETRKLHQMIELINMCIPKGHRSSRAMPVL